MSMKDVLQDKNAVTQLTFNDKAVEIGKQILSELSKNSLTYEEAYAGLKFADAALRFTSNFVEIQPNRILEFQDALRGGAEDQE